MVPPPGDAKWALIRGAAMWLQSEVLLRAKERVVLSANFIRIDPGEDGVSGQ